MANSYVDSFGNTLTTNDATLAGSNQQTLNTSNPPINTAQPSPTTTVVNPGSSATSSFYLPTTPTPGVDPKTVYNAQGQPLSAEQYAAQGGKADFSNVQKVPTIQAALDQAKASGPAPQDAGAAAGKVQTALAPIKAAQDQITSLNNTTQKLTNDPGYQQLLADATQAKNVLNQQVSLVDTYKKLEAEAGLPAINTELLNTQKIINGTEDDIRNEVQAASGFATNSQVMALASARNKTLIQNYNNLLATKTNAENHINTMIGLAGQDRADAINAANQQLQIDAQLADYRQKFIQNAQAAYKNVIDAVGYQGLYQSLQGDPGALSLAEQTLGFAPGQLQQIVSSQNAQANLKAIQEAGITTPYVLRGNEVQNTQTGQGYVNEADFQAKTGMTLAQAGAKGLISKYEGNIDTQLKKEQLAESKAEAPLNLALKKSQLETDALQRANIRSEIANRGKKEIPTSVVEVGGKKLLINSQTGDTIKEIGGGTENNPQALAQAQSNVALVGDLLNKAKSPSSVGVGSNFLRNALVFGSKKSDFIAGINQLTSQLTLDSLTRAKAAGATFGALSEGELGILAGSATKLNSWAIKDKNGNITGYNTSGKSFNAELDKINNFAKLDYIYKGGNPEDVGVKTMPDGTHWTQNSDGSMTQL